MDWNAMARPWIDHEAPIEMAHAPVRRGLIDRAALKPGETVLDLGCGSGAVTLDAADRVGPKGRVIAFDIAGDFVSRVGDRTRDLAHVETVQGDAQRHDLSGTGCDAVLSLFGTMFFDDPAAAFANIATALSRGGRIVFATWAGPQHNPWFSVPGRALAEALPQMPGPDPSAPGPMAFADTARVTDLMSGAGFGDVSAEEVDTHLTPIGAAADVTAMMLAVGPFRGAVSRFARQGQEGALIDAIAARVTEGYGSFATADGIRVPARVVFYKGTKAA